MSQVRIRKTVDGGHRVGIPKALWKELAICEGSVVEVWPEGDILCVKKVDVEEKALEHLRILRQDVADMKIPSEVCGKINGMLDELEEEISDIYGMSVDK